MTTRNYRRYEPRLKNLVAESVDIKHFLHLGIPPSTLCQWIHNGIQEFFTLPELPDFTKFEPPYFTKFEPPSFTRFEPPDFMKD